MHQRFMKLVNKGISKVGKAGGKIVLKKFSHQMLKLGMVVHAA